MENNPTWTLVVALALRDAAGRWLMHRRPAHKHDGGLWEFPGGKVEPGEMPADALVREAKEELGIVLDPAELNAVCFAQEPLDYSQAPIVILLYTASRWSGTPAALEGGAVAWFAPEDIAGLDKPPLDVTLSRRLFAITDL